MEQKSINTKIIEIDNETDIQLKYENIKIKLKDLIKKNKN